MNPANQYFGVWHQLERKTSFDKAEKLRNTNECKESLDVPVWSMHF